MLEIKELHEDQVPEVHSLSVEIFGQDAKDEEHSIEKWKEHLAKNGLLLGAFDDGKLVGFKFGYQREPETLHSWLAGVQQEYRRRGIMRSLLERQEELARERGYRFLTVNTYKASFPAMYELLIHSHYQVMEEKFGKSFFRKEL